MEDAENQEPGVTGEAGDERGGKPLRVPAPRRLKRRRSLQALTDTMEAKHFTALLPGAVGENAVVPSPAAGGNSDDLAEEVATLEGQLARLGEQFNSLRNEHESVKDEKVKLSEELDRFRERLHLAEMMALRAQSEKSEGNRRAAELQKKLDAADEAAMAQREELDRRQAHVDAARKVVEQAKAQVERAKADMDQQRRRFTREAEEIRNTAEERLMRELLPALDNFLLAFDTFDQTADAQAFVDGMRMIHRAMLASLNTAGLERLDPLGEPFDPTRHDAATTMVDEEKPDGAVAKVMRAGYALKGKVLRPAMVAVNKLPPKPKPIEAMDYLGDSEGDGLPETPLVMRPGLADTVRLDQPPGHETETAPKTKPLDDAWKFLETRFDD